MNYTVLDSPRGRRGDNILSVGSSNYDIVTMNASPELARGITRGFWKEIDPSRIPNLRNADPKILEQLRSVDPGNRHAVPWMWGTSGDHLQHRQDQGDRARMRPPTASTWSSRRSFAAKFAACGIDLIDSWGDILPMVARYLGQDEICRANLRRGSPRSRRSCKGMRTPMCGRISTSGYYQQLAEGDLCLAIGYSGDAL